jgi:hypothetical protein
MRTGTLLLPTKNEPLIDHQLLIRESDGDAEGGRFIHVAQAQLSQEPESYHGQSVPGTAPDPGSGVMRPSLKGITTTRDEFKQYGLAACPP